MKHLLSISVVMVILLGSCESSQDRINRIKAETIEETSEPQSLAEAEKDWESNFGVGPIQNLEFPAEIDETLAAQGKEVFEAKCTACHKVGKKFIGPAPDGIFNRRTPAWVMNMILNPEKMVQEDAIAKYLLIEYNGSPMANQNLKEEEARAVLEYFRTL